MLVSADGGPPSMTDRPGKPNESMALAHDVCAYVTTIVAQTHIFAGLTTHAAQTQRVLCIVDHTCFSNT